MIKAEQKKIAKLEKTEFIARMYGIVMESIVEHTKNLRSKLQVRTTYQGSNRYIKLHFYGRDVSLLLYQDGKVVIQLDEFAHSKYEKIFFDYEENKEQKEEFEIRFREILAWLLKVFIDADVMDFHSYMDFVSETGDMVIAYQEMHKYCEKYYE